MEWIICDLSRSVRGLLRDRWFSLLTVAAIAMGCAAAIFAFSLSNTMVFAPLKMNSERPILAVEATTDGALESGGKVSHSDFVDIKSQQTVFSVLGAGYTDTATVTLDSTAERFRAAIITPEMFDITGVSPQAGRPIATTDTKQGAIDVAVISHNLAIAVFGSAEQAIGEPLYINGKRHDVIGVMPAAFAFPVDHQIWLPLRESYQEYERDSATRLMVFGVLKNGVSMEEAGAELKNIAERLRLNYPETNRNAGFAALPFKQWLIGDAVAAFYMLLTAAAIVLLLACINVSSMLSARANKRIKETSIQAALGAPRYRIMARTMLESAVVCAIGALVGIVLAALALDGMQSAINLIKPTPFWWLLGLDVTTAGVTILLVVLASLIAGIWPAIQSSEANFNQVLRDGTSNALGKKSARFNQVILLAELSLSFVVLIYSGLRLSSMLFIMGADYGVTTDNILTGKVILTEQVSEGPARANYLERLERELTSLPDVDAVAMTTTLPAEYPRKYPYQIAGDERAHIDDYNVTNPIYVSTNFFEIFDVSIVQGRGLDSRDDTDGIQNVVVSELFSEMNWPGKETVVGERFRIYDGSRPGPWLTVVGVVPHIVHGQVQSNAYYRTSIYRPISAAPASNVSLALSSSNLDLTLRESIREKAFEVSKYVPVVDIKSMNEIIADNSSGAVLVTTLFGVLAVASLVLSATCVFGVIAYLVTQHRQDIAVRRALGADESAIYRLYLKKGVVHFCIAAAIGAPLAYVAITTINLTNISNTVPLVFGGTFALLFSVLTVATVVPVSGVLRRQPYDVLRTD